MSAINRTLNIKGGKLLAFGSASQKTLEKFSSNKTDLYYVKAMAIIKVEKDEITLEVYNQGKIISKTFTA